MKYIGLDRSQDTILKRQIKGLGSNDMFVDREYASVMDAECVS